MILTGFFLILHVIKYLIAIGLSLMNAFVGRFTLIFLFSVLFTACFNNKKDDQDSILTPKIEDKGSPLIDVGLPLVINVNDPVIKDVWPQFATVYVTGDSFTLNASFSDDRKLEKFWFDINPVFQLSVDNSGWEYTDTRSLTGTIRGFTNKYKIPSSIDGGFYKLIVNCMDSAGNLATPVQTYFIIRNTFDDSIPLCKITSLDTNNYNNNFVSIGGTVTVDGFTSDNISVKYYDVRVKNKNSQQVISTLVSQDQVYSSPVPVATSWTVPAGTPLGWYQVVLRSVDRYNNMDSLTVDVRVQP
jgi:hypothetical protein